MIPRPSGRSSTELSAQTGTRTGNDREHSGIVFALLRSLLLPSSSSSYSFPVIILSRCLEFDWSNPTLFPVIFVVFPAKDVRCITHCHIAYPGILQTSSTIINLVQPRFSSPHWMLGLSEPFLFVPPPFYYFSLFFSLSLFLSPWVTLKRTIVSYCYL